MYLKNSVFMVAGVSKSGIAATEFLLSHGAKVYVVDEIENEKTGRAFDILANLGAEKVDSVVVEEKLSEIDVLVLSPGIPIDNRIPVCAKRLGKRIIGELELGFLYSNCPVIGITGTNGKTTVCTMVSEVLMKAGIENFKVGNIGVPFTKEIDKYTPETVAVTEVSSFQLETTQTFCPHIAVVTNISEDHLIRHYNMQNYIYLKSKILFNMKESEFAVLGYDDFVVRGFKDKTKAKVVWFSAKEKVDGAYIDGDMICYKDEEVFSKALLPAGGEHNLLNALATVAVCKCMKIENNVIAEGIIGFKGIRHRIEFVREFEGVKYFNDSKATNVGSTVNALSSMNGKTVLLLGGRDKEQSFDSLFEQLKDKNVDKVVLFGETRYKMLKSAEKASFEDVCVASNFISAVNLARTESKEGENVLLSPACASYDEFSGFEERGDKFVELVNAF
ncbi:MAG: UDP-N-acetylmuramoyl-L-alanine--D-glutamate ligase [Christensenellaceae bacterium]|nr:UDP-N-acetylmuramoyl-L-alanine--D-glutamate ligase [Christensenellaceae bacterium]MDD6927644.1 UDP-N-acetylmuramoyl-L-alanine--D-glutamate ligase [bacterium]MDY2851229.1 UDP-N-acetylmuramoyl-L-alanine--D-glutamate ligase [Christensenellaceae bacterium]